ncbi:PEGA domain-containing protein [Candidatus Daviesbacteria bacterium]|nr:PEGA domain-containing protein [Candidatus Daviesbacteria bacterium]
MKKTLFLLLVLLSILVILIRYSSKAEEILFGVKQKSGISIFSIPDQATVLIDNKEVGKTPFEDKNLEVKQYTIKLEKEGVSWQGNIKLNSGTVTIINRDLAQNQASSSGEILTLNKGRGITVVSNPQQSEVEIDGKSYGITPISINLNTGEHSILVSHPNYLKRSIKASMPPEYNLTVSVDLALSEVDLTTVSAPVITQTPEVLVKQTPTGFLRVRDQASLNGKEITKINTGEKLVLLEESAGWDRVRLPDGKEGFVSSAYVEKVEKQTN